MNAECNKTKFYYSCPHASHFVQTSWLCKQRMMPVTALESHINPNCSPQEDQYQQEHACRNCQSNLELEAPNDTLKRERNEVTITTWYKRVRKGLTYTYLTTPDAHDSLKTLWSTNIPSKIIIQFGWIGESRKWVIVVNLQNKGQILGSNNTITGRKIVFKNMPQR